MMVSADKEYAVLADRRETYLGDGLYVSLDPMGIKLRAPRIGGDHWVVLEPAVWEALLVWCHGTGISTDPLA